MRTDPKMGQTKGIINYFFGLLDKPLNKKSELMTTIIFLLTHLRNFFECNEIACLQKNTEGGFLDCIRGFHSINQ